MICYIKDRESFETKHHSECGFDAFVASIYDDVSTIEIPGGNFETGAGDFVFADGFYGIVREHQREGGKLILSCVDIAMLLDRDVFAEDAGRYEGTLEEHLRRVIEENFINVDDYMYRMPFLNVTAHTTTPGSMAPDVADGLWNIKAYAGKLRRAHNIFTEFSITDGGLDISIMKRDRPVHNVDLCMPGFEVLEESFSDSQVARVTAKDENGGVTDWYLLGDGSVTHDFTAVGRVKGAWEKVVVKGGGEAVREMVLDIFKENSHSHIIEFATERQYGFYDELVVRTRQGRILKSYISAIRKRSGDARTIYKTGELRLTLEESIAKENTK